jgi:hypothetical protein
MNDPPREGIAAEGTRNCAQGDLTSLLYNLGRSYSLPLVAMANS